jgi:hypothetical protein
VKAVIRACWDILLFRRPPQIFPHSWTLFAMVLAAFLFTDWLTILVQGITGLRSLVETAFDCSLQLAFLGMVLAARFVLPRLNQAFTAWLGAGILLNLLTVPVNAAGTLFTSDSAQLVLYIPWMMLAAWSMAVMAHILSHTLGFKPLLGINMGLIYGLVIGGVYVIVDALVTGALFPG